MHDRQDRQRSICLTTSAVGRPVVLQHVLDQIDAPARLIEFVAEQHIGRTGRGAKPAMHAGAQDFSAAAMWGSASWVAAKSWSASQQPLRMRPGLNRPNGSKLFSPAPQRGQRGVRWLEHLHGIAQNFRRDHEGGVPATRSSPRAPPRRRRRRRPPPVEAQPDQPPAPIEESLGARQVFSR